MAKFRQRNYLEKMTQGDAWKDWARDCKNGSLKVGSTESEHRENKDLFARISSREAFKTVVKDIFFDDDEFSEYAASTFHQGSIPYALQTALWEEGLKNGVQFNPLDRDALEANRTIKRDGERLIIEESVKVKKLISLENPGEIFLQNDSNENGCLLEAKARYVVSKNEGKWETQVSDIIFDYKDNRANKYFDKRNVFTRIKDWFKNKFGINEEKDISSFAREPKFIFLQSKEDNSGSYCNKEFSL